MKKYPPWKKWPTERIKICHSALEVFTDDQMQALKPCCGREEFTTALNNLQREAFTRIIARYPEAKIEKKKKEKESKEAKPKKAEGSELIPVVAPSSLVRDSPTPKEEKKSVSDDKKLENVGKKKEEKEDKDNDDPALPSLKRALSLSPPTITRAAVGTTAEAAGSKTKDDLVPASPTKDTKIENAVKTPELPTSSVKDAKTQNAVTSELPASSSCVYEENLSRIKGRIKKSSPCLPDKQITLRMQLRVLRRELSTLRSLGPTTVSAVLEEIAARESSGKRLKRSELSSS